MEQRSPLLSLWSLPQPVFVFGCTILTASAFTTRWMDPESLVSFFVLAPIPFLLVLERFMPRRQDWLLNWRDLAEDTFWVLATYFIWNPIYDESYDTPISNAFSSLRDVSGFPYRLEAETVIGLLIAAMVGIFAKVHRLLGAPRSAPFHVPVAHSCHSPSHYENERR